jgi:hypothetical protein
MFGEPEVHQVRPAGGVELNIRRRDIAMDDAIPYVVEGIRDTSDHPRFRIDSPAPQRACQRARWNNLDEVKYAFGRLTCFCRDKSRMPQRMWRCALAHEPIDFGTAGEPPRPEQLDGDDADSLSGSVKRRRRPPQFFEQTELADALNAPPHRFRSPEIALPSADSEERARPAAA